MRFARDARRSQSRAGAGTCALHHLEAPAGNPAAWAQSANSDDVSGAHSGGCKTTVLPDANAAFNFRVASISNAFRGGWRCAAVNAAQAGMAALAAHTASFSCALLASQI